MSFHAQVRFPTSPLWCRGSGTEHWGGPEGVWWSGPKGPIFGSGIANRPYCGPRVNLHPFRRRGGWRGWTSASTDVEAATTLLNATTPWEHMADELILMIWCFTDLFVYVCLLLMLYYVVYIEMSIVNVCPNALSMAPSKPTQSIASALLSDVVSKTIA